VRDQHIVPDVIRCHCILFLRKNFIDDQPQILHAQQCPWFKWCCLHACTRHHNILEQGFCLSLVWEVRMLPLFVAIACHCHTGPEWRFRILLDLYRWLGIAVSQVEKINLTYAAPDATASSRKIQFHNLLQITAVCINVGTLPPHSWPFWRGKWWENEPLLATRHRRSSELVTARHCMLVQRFDGYAHFVPISQTSEYRRLCVTWLLSWTLIIFGINKLGVQERSQVTDILLLTLVQWAAQIDSPAMGFLPCFLGGSIYW